MVEWLIVDTGNPIHDGQQCSGLNIAQRLLMTAEVTTLVSLSV